jgi:hypothetical protein
MRRNLAELGNRGGGREHTEFLVTICTQAVHVLLLYSVGEAKFTFCLGLDACARNLDRVSAACIIHTHFLYNSTTSIYMGQRCPPISVIHNHDLPETFVCHMQLHYPYRNGTRQLLHLLSLFV